MPAPDSPSQDFAERRIERAFEDAPATIAIHRGPEHRFIFVNKAFRSAGDGRALLGRTYADAFPEFVEQGFLTILDEVYRTGTAFVANGARADTPRVPGGPPEERYWNLTFQANLDDDGRVDGVTSFAFEVTEHILARAAAEAAEKRYDDLVDAVNVVAWCVDPRGWRPVWVRGAVDAVLGLTAGAALVPEVWWANVHPDDLATVRAARTRLVEPGDRYRVDYRFAEPSGWRWLAESGQLRAEPTGPCVLGLTLDVSERVAHQEERDRLQSQLVRAQKLEGLGVLAGGVAHDFNNLLTAILGNASLAEAQLEPRHPAAATLAVMSSAARRASELTRQLLAFSGRGRFHVEPVDLNRQLAELVVLLSSSIAPTVSLKLQTFADLPPVEGDRSQLDQVLMNLLLNGADAITGPSGTVVIRTGVEQLTATDLVSPYAEGTTGLFCYVEVSDDGHGMTAETLARIFDPFYTTKANGRGLGLAAVQGIVRGHRGLIRVSSEPGRGTTFKVYLPALAGSIRPDPEQPPLATVRSGTILVVDDEPAVREFLRAALEHGKYRVFEAEDGVAGVDLFRARADEIDLVILDLTMPRLSGDKALEQLRTIRAHTPIVLSSGYTEVEAAHRLKGHGGVEFLQKPYTMRELLALVARLI